MESQRFDRFTHLLGRATPRRRLLAGLALSPLAGLVTPRHADDVMAGDRKKKRKNGKNGKKPRPNAYGCLSVGQPCQGDGTRCCSGICEGKKPKKGKKDTSRCVAHDAGTCQQEETGICLSDAPANLSCNNNARCRCFTTTAGSNVCAELWPPPRFCADCQRDADCAALGFPAGTACAPFFEGFCGGSCPSGMACVAPCGTEPPDPIG